MTQLNTGNGQRAAKDLSGPPGAQLLQKHILTPSVLWQTDQCNPEAPNSTHIPERSFLKRRSLSPSKHWKLQARGLGPRICMYSILTEPAMMLRAYRYTQYTNDDSLFAETRLRPALCSSNTQNWMKYFQYTMKIHSIVKITTEHEKKIKWFLGITARREKLIWVHRTWKQIQRKSTGDVSTLLLRQECSPSTIHI